MFNNHTMSLVTDLNILGPAINNSDFITIAAITTSDYPRHPNIYNASILMPPTEILMAWADNNPLVLQNEYPKYLMTKEPDDIIIALIAAMTKKNVILYIPGDEFQVFGMHLLQHLYFMYGITCNFMKTQFSVDRNKLPFIMAKFYMIDVMSADDFLASYPANTALPEFAIVKLASERPFNKPASFQEYADYFNRLNASKALNSPANVMVQIVGDNK